MNILHINSYYYGGKFYKNLYDKQTDIGLKITVYLPTSKKLGNVNFNYGDYTLLSRSYNKLDRFFFRIKQAKILSDIKKKCNISNYSIIHAHSLFTNGYVAYKLKKKFSIPYIVAVRNTDVNIFFQKLFHLRRIGLRILMGAEKIIFLSNSYKNLVMEKYVPKNIKSDLESKSLVVPNGIDDFWFNNTNKPKELLSKNIVFIQVGDIDFNKNIISTLAALQELIKKGISCSLTSVGKIRDKKVFNTVCKNKQFNYFGVLNKEELLNIYRKSDIFIMPSHKETFGLVYAEAMSQGLPVIYTKGQGFDEQFCDGEVGYSVEPNNPNDIASRIMDVINNYKDISNCCIKNVNKFKWDKIIKTYLKLYKEVSKE